MVTANSLALNKRFLSKWLVKPGQLDWPVAHSKFLEVRKECLETLGQQSYALLDLSIFTSFILTPEHSRPSFIQNTDLKTLIEYLPFFSDTPEMFFQGKWLSVPVAAVPEGGGSAKITAYMIGCFDNASCWTQNSPYPNWVVKILDDEAKESIHSAIQGAQHVSGQHGKRICVFPLCCPDSTTLMGNSCGLPIALASATLLQNRTINPTFLATGGITSERITTVNNSTLADKLTAAINQSPCPSLFLYPEGNTIPPVSDLRCVPVSNLRQAIVWADCYRPGRYNDVQRLDLATKTMDDFINNINALLDGFIEWLQHRHFVREMVADICKSEGLSARFAGRLDEIYSEEKEIYSYRKAPLIARLLTESTLILKMYSTNRLAAFSWCLTNYKLATHDGDKQLETTWGAFCDKWVEEVSEKDGETGGKLVVSYVNSRYGIGERHNNYQFSHEMHETYINTFKIIQRVYEATCNVTGICKKSNPLGSMHGTIGQNYAFCGKVYLDQATSHFGKALKFFRKEKDQRRQNLYLFFAQVDAITTDTKNSSNAMKNLLMGLNLEQVDDIRFEDVTSKPYQLHALLRAICEIPEQFWKGARQTIIQSAKNWFDSPAARDGRGHPWQLVWYNYGRLALAEGTAEIARQAWNQSYDLCMMGGLTIKVMALLPLSSLKLHCRTEAAKQETEIMDKAEAILNIIQESEDLCKEHFKPLLDAQDPDAALLAVAENRALYFPFNYR